MAQYVLNYKKLRIGLKRIENFLTHTSATGPNYSQDVPQRAQRAQRKAGDFTKSDRIDRIVQDVAGWT